MRKARIDVWEKGASSLCVLFEQAPFAYKFYPETKVVLKILTFLKNVLRKRCQCFVCVLEQKPFVSRRDKLLVTFITLLLGWLSKLLHSQTFSYFWEIQKHWFLAIHLQHCCWADYQNFYTPKHYLILLLKNPKTLISCNTLQCLLSTLILNTTFNFQTKI